MDRTTVQSNKANNKVAKLCHAVRSSFQIIRGIGRGGYIVRKLNKPDSTEFKFMSEDLFILIPSLKPCEPGDGSNIRYFNQYHAPIVKWFGTPPQTFSPPFKQTRSCYIILSSRYYNSFP